MDQLNALNVLRSRGPVALLAACGILSSSPTVAAQTFDQQAKLQASDAATHDSFGYSVALQGDMALIGAPNHNHEGGSWVGSCFVFGRNGTAWAQEAELRASDATSFEQFGISC